MNAQAKEMVSTVGKADRDKLDGYFTSVRGFGQRLAQAESWSNKPKPAVTAPVPKEINDRADLIGCSELVLRHL